MKINSLTKELFLAREQKRTLLAVNYYNAETLKGILMAAKDCGSPIILQLTRSSIEYLGLDLAITMGKTALDQFNVKGWVHLDHGDNIELAQRCLDAGFDSVMIDASERSMEENMKTTAEVVRRAEKYNANVEAELGYVAKLGQSEDKTGFTEPYDAKLFYESTGVNALAIAIGTSHGFYKKKPKLDMERLQEISNLVPIPLVLHGASGIPAESLKMAVLRGVCKINIATEVKNIFMQTLKQKLLHTDEIDLRKVFPDAIQAVRDLVKDKIKNIN
jgi:fructose-bisphosphate aldolase class II/tagatose 1,6-diphosphate aldolase GatY/KbaY